MAEIPSVVWMGVGAFIAIVSLFLGFVRPVELNGFFQIMLFVGLGMIGFGYIKMKVMTKSPEQMREEMRGRRRGPSEIEIGSENRQHHHTAQHPVHHMQHAHQPAQHHQVQPAQPQANRFCSQCGTPLLKDHKFCPICGARA